MEFWGVEVKSGEPLKVKPDEFCMIHLSQAALGESKKGGNETVVPLYLKFDDKKLVLGTLSPEIPQVSFDLVFEKEFELSHSWKHGSVFFCGYQAPVPDGDVSDFSSDEEDIPLEKVENEKPAVPAKDKPAAKAEKPEKLKAALVEPSKGDDSDEDDSDEDDESDEDDDSDEDDENEEGMSVDGGSDDGEDDSGSEEEQTPKKAEVSKKRVNDSATKTPMPSKKVKTATPQKTDGKKPAQGTPHPKKAGKGAANGTDSKSPKSGGQFSCKSCDRSFGSDTALKSHSQAKHGDK